MGRPVNPIVILGSIAIVIAVLLACVVLVMNSDPFIICVGGGGATAVGVLIFRRITS